MIRALILMASGATMALAGCDEATAPATIVKAPIVEAPGTEAAMIDYARWEPRIADRAACLDRIARVAPEIPADARATGIAFHCEVGPTMAIARRMAESYGRPVSRIAECGTDRACIATYQQIHAEVMAGPADTGSIISGPEAVWTRTDAEN